MSCHLRDLERSLALPIATNLPHLSHFHRLWRKIHEQIGCCLYCPSASCQKACGFASSARSSGTKCTVVLNSQAGYRAWCWAWHAGWLNQIFYLLFECDQKLCHRWCFRYILGRTSNETVKGRFGSQSLPVILQATSPSLRFEKPTKSVENPSAAKSPVPSSNLCLSLLVAAFISCLDRWQHC